MASGHRKADGFVQQYHFVKRNSIGNRNNIYLLNLQETQTIKTLCHSFVSVSVRESEL